MSLDNTVSELVQRVRDLTDEANATDISDAMIIRMLNKAQQELVRIVSRHYGNHFMREVIYTNSDLITDANGVSRVIQMSSQAFGFAVNSIEVKSGTSWFPVQQVPFSYTLGLDLSGDSNLPLSYAIQGNDIFLFPTPGSSTSIRVRYQFRAPQLVASQGRITSYTNNDAGTSDTLVLDALGSGLGTSVDDLSAFINIVDHLTGEIKATMQVTGINTTSKTLTLKASSLDRSTVFGYTTSTSLPSTISKDDYVCLASGTCVPFLSHDMTNFLVEMANFDVKRALGTLTPDDHKTYDNMIKAISSMQFGRQHTKKISRTHRSNNYSMQAFFRGN